MPAQLSQIINRFGWLAFGGAIISVLLAAFVEVAAVHSARIADWYMHLAMWCLLTLYFLLATWVVSSKKKLRGWANVAFLEILSVFWITILISKIPSERIVVGDQLVTREPLHILWVSVVLLALSSLTILVLAAVKLSGTTSEK